MRIKWIIFVLLMGVSWAIGFNILEFFFKIDNKMTYAIFGSVWVLIMLFLYDLFKDD